MAFRLKKQKLKERRKDFTLRSLHRDLVSFPRRAPHLRRMLPAPLSSFLEHSKDISVPPTPLQSWLIAFSKYPIGDHIVVYVTIWLLFDNIGGIPTFVVLSCVCVYHMQLSRAAIRSSGWVTQNPEIVGRTSFLVLALGG